MAKMILPQPDALHALMDSAGRIAVRVTPNAKTDAIVIDEGQVKVRVTAVPEDGKANKAVIALMAKALGVSKSSVVIVRGETSREKLLQIT